METIRTIHEPHHLNIQTFSSGDQVSFSFLLAPFMQGVSRKRCHSYSSSWNITTRLSFSWFKTRYIVRLHISERALFASVLPDPFVGRRARAVCGDDDAVSRSTSLGFDASAKRDERPALLVSRPSQLRVQGHSAHQITAGALWVSRSTSRTNTPSNNWRNFAKFLGPTAEE